MLDTGSVRVKRFIVQKPEDDPELDDVSIAFSRVTEGEFQAVCERLEAIPGVRLCRRGE